MTAAIEATRVLPRPALRRAGPSLGRIAVLVGLCALPAHGQGTSLAPQILYALTSIDELPTRQDLESILASPTNELSLLRQYALGSELDFGVRLRAVRALSHFCAESRVECREVLAGLLADPGAGSSPGQQILLRRAAIETLGVSRTGDSRDVSLLAGFLNDGSRDLRVAATRALRDLCDPAAMPPLRTRRSIEQVAQVIHAIDDALSVLAQCGP